MRMGVAAQFNAWAHNDWISWRPFLAIVGTDADNTRPFSERAVELAKEPKERFLIEGASHIDMHDSDKYVPQAVDKLTDYFGQHLKA